MSMEIDYAKAIAAGQTPKTLLVGIDNRAFRLGAELRAAITHNNVVAVADGDIARIAEEAIKLRIARAFVLDKIKGGDRSHVGN